MKKVVSKNVFDDLRKILVEHYKFEKLDLELSVKQGWDAKSFVLNKKFFVKFFVKTTEKKASKIKFSYHCVVEMEKLLRAEKKVTVSVPHVILNKMKEPTTISKVGEKECDVVVVLNFIKGTQVEMEFRKYHKEVAHFLRFLGENTKKILSTLPPNLLITKHDFSMEFRSDYCAKMLKKKCCQKHLKENELSQTLRFLDLFPCLCKEMTKKKSHPHVLNHTDIHGWNFLKVESGSFVMVDWDEVSLAPFEWDLIFFSGFSDELDCKELQEVIDICHYRKLYSERRLLFFHSMRILDDLIDILERFCLIEESNDKESGLNMETYFEELNDYIFPTMKFLNRTLGRNQEKNDEVNSGVKAKSAKKTKLSSE